MRECLRQGIAVPRELAVTGYDNIGVAAMFGLTTVEQHFEKIGERAVDILMSELDGQLSAPCHDRVASELIIRDSLSPSEAR